MFEFPPWRILHVDYACFRPAHPAHYACVGAKCCGCSQTNTIFEIGGRRYDMICWRGTFPPVGSRPRLVVICHRCRDTYSSKSIGLSISLDLVFDCKSLGRASGARTMSHVIKIEIDSSMRILKCEGCTMNHAYARTHRTSDLADHYCQAGSSAAT